MGDVGVNLTAAITFLFLFPRRSTLGIPITSPIKKVLFFISIVLLLLLCFAKNRGGLLAVLVPLIFCFTQRSKEIGIKAIAMCVVSFSLAFVLFSSGLLDFNQTQERSFSSQQIRQNFTSIVSSDSQSTDSALQDTKEWRLGWWQSILDSTVFGPYFWTGRGFGVNLTLLPGAPAEADINALLRSPHNGTMTVLARMGVPGLILWVTINVLFSVRMMRMQILARELRDRFWSNVLLWLLCIWLAAAINSCFDVYLESPQGGILFWSTIGFGEAVMRMYRNQVRSEMTRMKALRRRFFEGAFSQCPTDSRAQIGTMLR
jgi:O-antigen ligase